jgi:hypothetical protein
MTLIEMLVFIVLSLALLAVGRFLSGRWGTAGWLVGVLPVGIFWTYVAYGIVRGTFLEVRHSLSPRPICRQGRCKTTAYVLVSASSEKALFRCRCGDLYLSKANRFSQIMPDNSLKPYMVRDSSSPGWKADEEALS